MNPDIKPFKIRDVEINPPLILSPMAGVTDVSFRRLLKRRGGVGLSVSEFISVEGLTRSNPKSKRQMRFYADERPFAVQIFGERLGGPAEFPERDDNKAMDKIRLELEANFLGNKALKDALAAAAGADAEGNQPTLEQLLALR